MTKKELIEKIKEKYSENGEVKQILKSFEEEKEELSSKSEELLCKLLLIFIDESKIYDKEIVINILNYINSQISLLDIFEIMIDKFQLDKLDTKLLKKLIDIILENEKVNEDAGGIIEIMKLIVNSFENSQERDEYVSKFYPFLIKAIDSDKWIDNEDICFYAKELKKYLAKDNMLVKDFLKKYDRELKEYFVDDPDECRELYDDIITLDKKVSGLVKLTISNFWSGLDVGAVIIKNKEKKELIKDLIEEGEVSAEIYDEDGEELLISYFKGDEEIFYTRGPELEGESTNIKIEAFKEEKEPELIIDETPLYKFPFNVSYICPFLTANSDEIIFFGGYYGKRASGEVFIDIPKNEKLNLDFIYFVGVKLACSINEEITILDKVLYIPDNIKEKIKDLYETIVKKYKESTPYFSIANCYDIISEYKNLIGNEKATELNQLYALLNNCECRYDSYVSGDAGEMVLIKEGSDILYTTI